jgi:hypothetical protein
VHSDVREIHSILSSTKWSTRVLTDHPITQVPSELKANLPVAIAANPYKFAKLNPKIPIS